MNDKLIQAEDFKFMNPGGAPDPDFNPERNKAVIAATIRKNEAIRRRRQKDYNDQLAERADAVASFLKAKDMNSGMTIEKYFSEQDLSHLRMESFLTKVTKERAKFMAKRGR
jgi:hypothetical protein